MRSELETIFQNILSQLSSSFHPNACWGLNSLVSPLCGCTQFEIFYLLMVCICIDVAWFSKEGEKSIGL